MEGLGPAGFVPQGGESTCKCGAFKALSLWEVPQEQALLGLRKPRPGFLREFSQGQQAQNHPEGGLAQTADSGPIPDSLGSGAQEPAFN